MREGDEMPDGGLPEGFQDLMEFVPDWVGESGQARWDIRAAKSMHEIQHFYDRVLSRADAILAHVEQFPLKALPPQTLRLYQLLLALAQAAMAVELHGQPRAHHSPYPHGVRLLRGLQPVA